MLKTISENPKYSDLGFASTDAVSKMGIDPKLAIYTSNDAKYAKKLLNKYRSFVRRRCQVKNSMDIRITEIYSDLFEKLGTKFHFQKVKGKDDKEYWYPCNSSAYTTNYDKVVETYWQGITYINDLWKRDVNPEVLDTEKREAGPLTLVKLHGSLDWFGLDNGEIVKLDSRKSTYGKRKVKGELMLYPIQQKDLYLHPWFNLFYRLRQDLQYTKIWLVIGYNFNDEFIRNIFVEALERKEVHKLILVTPNAAEVLERYFFNYRSKVKIVPKKFGDAQTSKQICKLIKLN